MVEGRKGEGGREGERHGRMEREREITHTHTPLCLCRGMRSGTLPAPLAVGLGAAAEVCMSELEYDARYVEGLAQRLIQGITSQIPHVVRNGDPEKSYHG